MRLSTHLPVCLAVALAVPIIGPARAEVSGRRAAFAEAIRSEALKATLPFEVADAVVAIESGYDPGRIGGVGEIGLMQVRPATAAMLGFRGSDADLARPEVNIHYGVAYLAQAWRQSGGDLCRALMKYRAGHGEEIMSPLSVTYCARARAHLAAVGSTLAQGAVPLAVALAPVTGTARHGRPGRNPLIGMSPTAFWAAHTARIRALDVAIARKWRRMAAR